MGFGVGWTEIVMVILVAVLVVKPDRWPETARFLGRAYRQFRLWWLNMANSLKEEVAVIKQLDQPAKNLAKPIKALIKDALDLNALDPKDTVVAPAATPEPKAKTEPAHDCPGAPASPRSLGEPSQGYPLAEATWLNAPELNVEELNDPGLNNARLESQEDSLAKAPRETIDKKLDKALDQPIDQDAHNLESANPNQLAD
ncbi:MAG: twin-arginine translocase TatA/TatE family subunit [Deltaproteobacteria bacterium]|jgi:Sec-independent protein translocase protein TatA|nr:twin-arginine translocase TatA/TatE family subunit [Deltaproteobacteria bacterium]